MPEYKERDNVIVFSNEIECKCGRLKNKPHCPRCGLRSRIRAYVGTNFAAMPDGDILRGCVSFHCGACGKDFNDIDWYFECQAPIDIDMRATQRKQRERDEKKQYLNDWMVRIRQGESFSPNDMTQCKAQTGLSLQQILGMVQHEKANQNTWGAPKPVDNTALIEQRKKQIAFNQNLLKTEPYNKEHADTIEWLTKDLERLEKGED